MRVLLIRPPATYIEGAMGPCVSMPLGLAYIASYLLNNSNHDIRIYDCLAQSKFAGVFTKSPFDKHMHFGAPWEEVAERISEYKPNIIGISNNFTIHYKDAIKTAEIAKEIDNKILTVVGGPHASVCPESFFKKTGKIDVVCTGEGEITFFDVVNSYADKKPLGSIKGIVYKDKDGIKVNKSAGFIKNLDEIPFPAYCFLDVEKYFYLNKKGLGRPIYNYCGSERAVSLITSRGCPYSCSFCSVKLHMGNRYRMNSKEYVERHIDYLIKNYKIKHIHLEDDNLTFNKKRFENIIEDLRKRNITFDTPNGVRADTLDLKTLRKIKACGCTSLSIGVESGSQKILDTVINKKMNLEKVKDVSAQCFKQKINLQAFFVIGIPGETKKDIYKTLDFALFLAKKYHVFPNVFVATPLLGTKLFNECKDNGLLTDKLTSDNLAKSITGHSLIKTEEFDSGFLSKKLDTFKKKRNLILLKNTASFLLFNARTIKPFIKETIHGPNDLSRLIRLKYSIEHNNRSSTNYNFEEKLTGRHFKCMHIAGSLKNKKILDIGCNFGFFERFALEEGCNEIHAIDPDKKSLIQAKVNSPGAFYIQGTADKLPFPENNFDLITLFDVIEHIDKSKVGPSLDEIRRVLKPGGKLALSTPNKTFISNITDPAWFLIGHRHYSAVNISRLLESRNFKITSLSYGGRHAEIIGMTLLYLVKHLTKTKIPFKYWLDKTREEEFLLSDKGFTTLFIEVEKK